MEQDMLVLGYKGYDFVQEGNKVSGAKVHMINLNASNEQLLKGNIPVTQNFELAFVNQLPYFPGVYKAKFEMVPGKNGKATLECTSLTPVKKVDFTKC